MQLCSYSVKVPKGKEGHKQQMTDSIFCHNRDMLLQLLNEAAQYSTHDNSLSCVVLCALQQPHVKLHGFVCMVARYQLVVLLIVLTSMLCCGALKKFTYYAQYAHERESW